MISHCWAIHDSLSNLGRDSVSWCLTKSLEGANQGFVQVSTRILKVHVTSQWCYQSIRASRFRQILFSWRWTYIRSGRIGINMWSFRRELKIFAALTRTSPLFYLLPPFSLICDFEKQNTHGNVFKISVSLPCYRHIGSKSNNHSLLTWRREGQKVALVAVVGGFWAVRLKTLSANKQITVLVVFLSTSNSSSDRIIQA